MYSKSYYVVLGYGELTPHSTRQEKKAFWSSDNKFGLIHSWLKEWIDRLSWQSQWYKGMKFAFFYH